MRLTGDKRAAAGRWGVHVVEIVKQSDSFLFRPGSVGWGGNGGFHALNLVAQMGPARIVLVGYDMRVDLGLHWHGPHPRGMNNPAARNVARWRRCVDDAAGPIARLGVEVINCSPVSALQAYPKRDFLEVFAC